MLDPQDRNLLLEGLRPPAGCQLDHAIGTTFSLDLHAFLMAPLAFTFFDWEDENGHITSDPLALLESLRRSSGQISLFCQAGQISVPRKQERLFAYLENSVHEVKPPSQYGVFHPKVWLLRYIRADAPASYRLICMSRNLTFDKSWDTMLVLDGLLTSRRNAYGKNNPLGDFIQQLPSFATQPLPKETRTKIDLMQYEVRRVQFELPESVTDISFHPIGIQGHRNFEFSPKKRRMLIMSPFLSDSFLAKTITKREGSVLISRPDSLEELQAETLGLFAQEYTLSREAESEEIDDDEVREQSDAPVLSGLHAKLFVMDDGWKANVWTGSANATNAAFKNNIEFLVCLRGRRADFGIDKLLLQEKGKTTFADLLDEYSPPEEVHEPDPIKANLEKRLQEARHAIINGKFAASVSPHDKGSFYDLTISWDSNSIAPASVGVKISCWPVTMPRARAVSIDFTKASSAIFNEISLDAITAFFAFELECSEQGRTEMQRFVCRLPLKGEPAGRLQQLLKSLLKNRSQLLRLLLMLLADNSMPLGELLDMFRHFGGNSKGINSAPMDIPLLESLLKALAHDPNKLDRINNLITDLQKSDEGMDLLPDDFMHIWEPIWKVREGMHS